MDKYVTGLLFEASGKKMTQEAGTENMLVVRPSVNGREGKALIFRCWNLWLRHWIFRL